MEFYYARDYGDQRTLALSQILEEMQMHPDSEHHVWREGMEDWADAHSVPELAAELALLASTPGPEWGLPFRYSVDGKNQPAALAEEIASQVLAQPDSIHKVWQDDYLWWPFAQEVPEIAQFGPLPPIPGQTDADFPFRVQKNGKRLGELSTQAIVDLVRGDPAAKYEVWRPGMDQWLSPWDVPDFSDGSLGPAPTGQDRVWLVRIQTSNWKDQTADEVAELARKKRDPAMKIWRFGMKRWESPWDVDEIRSREIGESPETLPLLPWQYSGVGPRANELSVEEVVERVRQSPDSDHRVWQLGLEQWSDPYELEAFDGLLPVRTTDTEPRLLLHARNGKSQQYLSAEQILQEMKQHPDDRHQVWPHMTERWLSPWEVEELQALGVREPEDAALEIWHHRQGDSQHPNRDAGTIAIAIIQHPSEEHLVWQFGWERWEDPRDVAEIARLLPPENQ